MNISFKKFLIPINYLRYLRRLSKTLRGIVRGDVFSNPGPITDEDFEQIRVGIEEVKPKVFIEIGTSEGFSTKKIYNYLKANYPDCHFYTLDIYKKHYENARKQFANDGNFHPLLGLSVLKEEATPPASNKLIFYSGPSDILRRLFNNDLKKKNVDIAFIDSVKGTAVGELLLLEKKLSTNGIIFCHDILNNGKGVVVLEHIQKHPDKYVFEVIDTGPTGMIRIQLKTN